jgi:hypothetical protein
MANIIALIWDFDRTLIDGYMQDPMFEEYGVDKRQFWDEVNSLPEKYAKEQGVKVNPETIYLNHMIKYAREGKFAGLSNKKLREIGTKMKFYPGMPLFMQKAKDYIKDNPRYAEYDIKLENYIVSTGLTEVIKGSEVYKYVSGVWGCEFIERDGVIDEIAYTIDNTTKTRALFEINKGVGRDNNVKVNTMIPKEQRRVPFENMIYIADGPSDIPAFSVINQNHGHTFAIYPKGSVEALKQVEQMRLDNRIELYAVADYSEDTTAYLWLMSKIEQIAEEIRQKERNQIAKYENAALPRHL